MNTCFLCAVSTQVLFPPFFPHPVSGPLSHRVVAGMTSPVPPTRSAPRSAHDPLQGVGRVDVPVAHRLDVAARPPRGVSSCYERSDAFGAPFVASLFLVVRPGAHEGKKGVFSTSTPTSKDLSVCPPRAFIKPPVQRKGRQLRPTQRLFRSLLETHFVPSCFNGSFPFPQHVRPWRPRGIPKMKLTRELLDTPKALSRI